MTSDVSQHSGASLTHSAVFQPCADGAEEMLTRLLELREENKREADIPVPGGGGVYADAPLPLTGGQAASLPDKDAMWFKRLGSLQPPLHVPRPISLGPMAPPHYAGIMSLPPPGPAFRPPPIPLDIADEVMSHASKRVGRSSDRPRKKQSSRSGSFTSAKSTELAVLEDRVDNLGKTNDKLQRDNGSLGRRLAGKTTTTRSRGPTRSAEQHGRPTRDHVGTGEVTTSG